MTTTAPFGSWQSPVTADLLVSQTVRLAEPRLDGDDIYWLESRPQEKGRNALVRLGSGGQRQDLLPRPINVRSRAHEYGGASYCVNKGVVYFVLFDDQRIYRLNTHQADATTEAITPEGPYRYADLCVDQQRNQLLCVREDHSVEGQEESNSIVAISLDVATLGQVHVLAEGNDFYSNPRVSPDGGRLSWLTWNHPNMPWDETECWLADIDGAGELSNPQRIAGGNRESVLQPQWSPSGDLYLVSDRSNWWNLYRWDGQNLAAVTQLEAEFATPQWIFGMSTYGFLDADSLLCTFTRNGEWQLAKVDLNSRSLVEIETGYTEIAAVQCNSRLAVFIGASATRFEELVRYKGKHTDSLAHSSSSRIDEGYLSNAKALRFPVGENEHAYGFYYAPQNKDYAPPEGSKPPLVVLCHGGPTGATSSALNLKIQYWTSRGFAIFDINYRGSTGYGRTFRDRLKGNWGITDVADVCAGARYLVEQGLADPNRIAIKGGSAGGYTVLAALTFADTFKAGASHYGIGDLETLARDTHKFEARYLDSLVGPYPEGQATYQARSPINHTELLNCPVIFFQGLEDKVVPPNQAEAMFAALKNKGIATAYVPFEGEGHGFRQGPNIKTSLDGELYFYSKVFGFELPDISGVKGVEIAGLD